MEKTPKELRKVELGPKGTFKESGKSVKKVKILGSGLMQCNVEEPIFIGEQLPDGTNAYFEGTRFDLNLGETNVIQFVAPVIYLKIG